MFIYIGLYVAFLFTIAVYFHSLIVCIFKSCKLLWYYHKGFEILFALMQFERQNIIKIKSSIPHVHVSKTNWLSRLNKEECRTCSSLILSFFCAAHTCIRYKKKMNVTSMPYFFQKVAVNISGIGLINNKILHLYVFVKVNFYIFNLRKALLDSSFM